MRGNSLRELIDRFVSYKKDNGYQYQTGAYYLERYALFVMGTAPETVVPDKKSVEGFLENLQDTPGSLYNAAAFLREFSRYLIARGYADAYLIPPGRLRLPTPVQPYFFTEREIASFFVPGPRDFFPKQGRPSVQSQLSGAEFPAFLVCCFSGEKRFRGKHPGV